MARLSEHTFTLGTPGARLKLILSCNHFYICISLDEWANLCQMYESKQSATKSRHFSQHTCLTHILWELPLELVVASVVSREGIEEVSEGSPKTPLTLSLLFSLPGNRAGANVEVYNDREELREELPWAEWLLENKAQVTAQEWPTTNKQLLQEETALFKTDKETGEKTESGLTSFYGTSPALICNNHTAPQEPQLCPFLVIEWKLIPVCGWMLLLQRQLETHWLSSAHLWLAGKYLERLPPMNLMALVWQL